MSEKFPEQPERREHEPVHFEAVKEELKRLNASGIKDPEFSDDPAAKAFQEMLKEVDEQASLLTGSELEDYWLRRSTLFIEAGYTDSDYVHTAIEFLEQDLMRAEDAGDDERVRLTEEAIESCKKLLSVEAEPELPSLERITEILRQPGKLPREVHEMILARKTAAVAERGEKAETLVEIELEMARLYADNGRPLDAIGSLTGALIHNQTIKKAKPELKKILEDYRESLK
jgi:hypothetical protein